VPLRAATVLGTAAIAASVVFAAYSLLAKFLLGHSPVGFTALILAITFLAGVQLLFLGVIGEYVGRIYQEVKRRPLYVVDRVLTADTHTLRLRRVYRNNQPARWTSTAQRSHPTIPTRASPEQHVRARRLVGNRDRYADK